MPYKLSWESAGALFRFTGVVTDNDLIRSNADVYASPHFPEMRYQIVDLSTIDEFHVSTSAIRAVASSDRRAAQTNPGVRVAIINPPSTFMLGMSNMYALAHEAEGGSWVTGIFEREEDAREWVGSHNIPSLAV